MPVLGNVVRCLIPRVTLCSPWAVWLLPPHKGACFSADLCFIRTLSFCINILYSDNTETGGIVVAMTFPGHHCIGEYVIPYRNAISWSMLFDVLYPGLRFAHPGLSRRNEMKTELYCIVPLALVFGSSLRLWTGAFCVLHRTFSNSSSNFLVFYTHLCHKTSRTFFIP